MSETNQPGRQDDPLQELISAVVDQPVPEEAEHRSLQAISEWDVDSPRASGLASTSRGWPHAWHVLAVSAIVALVAFAALRLENSPKKTPSNEDPSAQSDRDLATSPEAATSLDDFLQLLRRRESALRRMSFSADVRFLKMRKTKRGAETTEQFIQRQAAVKPEFDPYRVQVSAQRDLKSNTLHVKFGDIQQRVPKYLEYLFDGKTTTQLMGVEPGRCQGTILAGCLPTLKRSTTMSPRLDIVAFRPILDNLLSKTIADAARSKGKLDANGRPHFELTSQRTADKVRRWICTFRHLQPLDARRTEILWYRLVWENRGGLPLIQRIDTLRVEGKPDDMPSAVTLLDDYRAVNGVPVPFRIRQFQFGNNFLLGSVGKVADCKINAQVKLPFPFTIPAGTSVRNKVTGERFRQR